ncbi:hypothetical protein [Pilimelia columellifera]|uniref:DUF3618 domain-containing protein n=1 Tax=Pilimelia columellifera subsp. columellifera TaxID=706583 RepID=A0ABN3MZ19_9ACTN
MTEVVTSRSPGAGAGPSTTAGGAGAEARKVTETAKAEGAQALGAVKEQAGEVTAEAGRQARSLASEATSQLSAQAQQQQQRAAGGLRAMGDELKSLTQNAESGGAATDLVRQASDKLTELAGWLEHREPGAVLAEVKDYARRKPGAFLLGAAVLGVAAGRLTRNLNPTEGAGPRPADSTGSSIGEPTGGYRS